MIELSSVHKKFGNTVILDGVSLSIKEGEKASLLGPGGCGKTTVLKMILGLESCDSGVIAILGKDLRKESSDSRAQLLKLVGMAFQQGGLFDFMTVRDNLLFAMEHMTEFSAGKMQAKVQDLLAAVKLGRTENMFPFELSGGMKRRVGIARALATEPTLAIFDEPTSGLDPVTSTIILNMINALAGQDPRRTLLVSTNNVEIAIRFAKRIILLNQGKIVADGDWRDLLVSGSEWVRHFLGVRLIGLDQEYIKDLDLPSAFVKKHWEQ